MTQDAKAAAAHLAGFAEGLTSHERMLLERILAKTSERAPGEPADGDAPRGMQEMMTDSFAGLLAELRTEGPGGRPAAIPARRAVCPDWTRRGIRGLLRLTSLGLAKGPHVTRYQMYAQLGRFGSQMALDSPVLSISDSQPLCRALGFADDKIVNVTYPEVSITALPLADASFESIVSDQVLEHVKGNPQAVIDETFRVLRPGGIAVHTTCLINPIHEVPGDYWRFTPAGLALLVERHGRVLERGGWGNLWVWPYILLGMRYEPIPHARWHPFHWLATHSSEGWPLSTWVVARKVG
ncbi:MAG TPA: methyltransferase domain-containing protein [Thermoanaerobaculia bacterium]|jgi:SAM-dependent methyltransferase